MDEGDEGSMAYALSHLPTLELGWVRRRRRERTAAKAALDEALGAFEVLGARLLVDRARA